MPNQVDDVLLHTMSGTELSYVRTELQRRRILTTIPPHPVQAHRQFPPHRHFGNAFVSTHRQVTVSASPLRVAACRRLGCLHQQESQQGVTLLADVAQSLLARTGLLTRNHPHVRADLLAALKPRRSSDDQYIGARDWIAPAPNAASPTSGLRLPASRALVSSTVPVLPTRVSSIAPSIP